MTSKKVTISIPSGLEARPIALLVQMASKYDNCKIYFETEDKRINAKSIMGMMSLGLGSGDVITVVTEGEDEEGACAHIAGYLAGEDE